MSDSSERLEQCKRSVPERLFQVIQAYGGVTEIAAELRVSTTKVYNWKDRNFPSINSILEIAVITGASMDWLLLGEGPAYRSASDDEAENQHGED